MVYSFGFGVGSMTEKTDQTDCLTVEQNLIEIRWWPSAFLLRDVLKSGQCEKHKDYWKNVTHKLVCDDKIIQEYIFPTENSIIEYFKKVIDGRKKEVVFK